MIGKVFRLQLPQDVQTSSFKFRLVFATMGCLLSVAPAQAGWMHNSGNGIVPALVRRAAQRVMQAELNDLRASQIAHFGSSAQARALQERRARVNPSMLTTTTSAFARPLPGYHWNQRPATDYLQNGEPESDDDVNQNDVRDARNQPDMQDSSDANGLRDYVAGRKGTSLPSPTPSTRYVPPSVVSQAFDNGAASRFSYEQLVAAKVFDADPLHGSVFKRKGSVHYIILHSTETASPADARRVILSWNNKGLRHPGSQFVVDRDGTICSTVNPDLVTVHIDTRKTLPGYSNDNSIGIEIVRSGKQQYTQPQLESVTRLVSYLQGHYGIADSDVTTHHHVQPSDRSDPVGFDFLAFENAKTELSGLASSTLPSQIYNPRSEHRLVSSMPRSAPDFRHRN